MPDPTQRFVTARVKRPTDRLFHDETFPLTLPFNGSRVDDDRIAARALTEAGYVVNTIISQRGPRLA